jgi:hypothetical protein
MEEIIDEIIIRFIFKGDVKPNKIISKESIIDKDVFIDTRNQGVSLLRTRYNNHSDCIKRGYEIKNDFIGFLIFRKNQFDLSVSQHKNLETNTFEAEIISSPLDENYQIIPIGKEVRIDTPINPGHSDLIYLNPGLITDDENPNVAIRRFSRRFFKMCDVFFESESN